MKTERNKQDKKLQASKYSKWNVLNYGRFIHNSLASYAETILIKFHTS